MTKLMQGAAEPSLECTACRVTVHDPKATLYTASGDLVCLACGARAEGCAADERVAAGRRGLIVGPAAIFSALSAFAIFAYAFHDKHSVYVENGHVLETSDASGTVLELGIFVALVAAGAGGALANWLVTRAQAKDQ